MLISRVKEKILWEKPAPLPPPISHKGIKYKVLPVLN
jgi:hypothetical protein